MTYWLKPTGMSGTKFPVDWWDDKPELHHAVYFGERPASMAPGDCLIYYAVAGDKRLVGVAEVLGGPEAGFPVPPGMPDGWAEKFKWRIPVRVLHRRPADASCPRLPDFTDVPMGPGSYKRVDAEVAVRMIDAVAAHARR